MTAHGDTQAETVRAGKATLRTRILAARRALPAQERARRAEALTAAALALAAGVDGPVCAYLPFGTEPGSPAMLEALRDAGHEVLLPVVAPTPGPMGWARFTGLTDTAPVALGMREPTGATLAPATLAGAGLVLVPGLAVDPAGIRMGRGRGHYDRTLALARPGVPVVVVLNDEELVEQVPAEPHDRPVSAALFPGRGVMRFRNTR